MDFHFMNAPLDPDERDAYIMRKIEGSIAGYPKILFKDPADAMAKELGIGDPVERMGVEPWLLPAPPASMKFMLTVENFVTFIDSNGCLEYANQIKKLVKAGLPAVPVIFGVDHSLTGGAVRAAAEEHGGENLRLVVFDSHFDFVLPSIRCGLIQYDLETNANTKFSAGDPFIFNRPDSYNADSFLHFIKKEVPPENIWIVGVSDYPPREAEEIGDERVRRYVDFYKGTVESGVHLIRKEDARSRGAEIKVMLSKTDKPYTYVSIDVDVCANTSLRGARFLDYHGLNHSDLYGLAAALGKSLEKSKLAGLDFMEFDVFKAGATISGTVDRAYPIMAETYRKIIGRDWSR